MKLRQILFVPPPPLLWAAASGAFVRAGLEVETIQTRSSDHMAETLIAGDAELGIAGMDNVVAWNRTAAPGW